MAAVMLEQIEDDEPRPAPGCRLYGFNGQHGMLIRTDGNHCGLAVTSHAPCYLEIAGEAPDENACRFISVVKQQTAVLYESGILIKGSEG